MVREVRTQLRCKPVVFHYKSRTRREILQLQAKVTTFQYNRSAQNFAPAAELQLVVETLTCAEQFENLAQGTLRGKPTHRNSHKELAQRMPHQDA